MPVGAVASGDSPLSTVLKRLAASQKPAEQPAATNGETPVITALRKRLEDAQEKLAEAVRSGAPEHVLEAARARVDAAGAALSAALTQQLEAEKKRARAAQGGQYA